MGAADTFDIFLYCTAIKFPFEQSKYIMMMQNNVRKYSLIQTEEELEDFRKEIAKCYQNAIWHMTYSDVYQFGVLWNIALSKIWKFHQKGQTIPEIVEHIQKIDNVFVSILVTALLGATEECGFYYIKNHNAVINAKGYVDKYFGTIFDKLYQKALSIRENCGIVLYASILEKELSDTKLRLQEAQAEIQKLQDLLDGKNIKVESPYDKQLTRQNILQYIREQLLYSNVNQIFTMLLGPMSRVAADEEYDEILSLRQEMIKNSRPFVQNNNDIHNSNVFQGEVRGATIGSPKGFQEK